MSIILWIDPWTTTTWFAIIESSQDINLVDFGVISTTPKIADSLKLLEIWQDIWALLERYHPDLIVIEKLFFNSNITTGIQVAQARWVVMYEAAKKWTAVLEYTPLQVKKAITWNGRAGKTQLQNAIKMLMRLETIPKPDDAADAIWLAYMWYLNIGNIWLV